MKFDAFRYDIRADVTLSAGDLVSFFDIAANHYDWKCRSLAQPKPEHNPFENAGWILTAMQWLRLMHKEEGAPTAATTEDLVSFCRANPELTYETTLTWGLMDTLCKTMEMANYVPDPPAELVWNLRQVMNKIRIESRRLHHQ